MSRDEQEMNTVGRNEVVVSSRSVVDRASLQDLERPGEGVA